MTPSGKKSLIVTDLINSYRNPIPMAHELNFICLSNLKSNEFFTLDFDGSETKYFKFLKKKDGLYIAQNIKNCKQISFKENQRVMVISRDFILSN